MKRFPTRSRPPAYLRGVGKVAEQEVTNTTKYSWDPRRESCDFLPQLTQTNSPAVNAREIGLSYLGRAAAHERLELRTRAPALDFEDAQHRHGVVGHRQVARVRVLMRSVLSQ
jgi:hypothetical protein